MGVDEKVEDESIFFEIHGLQVEVNHKLRWNLIERCSDEIAIGANDCMADYVEEMAEIILNLLKGIIQERHYPHILSIIFHFAGFQAFSPDEVSRWEPQGSACDAVS